MQVPTKRLLQSLNATVTRLLAPQVSGYASDEEAVLIAVRILKARAHSGLRSQAIWLDETVAQLDGLNRSLDLSRSAPDLAVDVGMLRDALLAAKAIDSIDRADVRGGELLNAWSALVARLATDDRLPAAARLGITRDVATVEADRLRRIGGEASTTAVEVDVAITAERLRAYLADRFGTGDVTVRDVRRIGGGYGKETTFFSVDGAALAGDFVMRRDLAVPVLDNDCHRIDREYPVIRAAFEQGFPAPDALWLDTDHPLLPGGDFLIMRRAAGQSGGSVFGPAGTVDRQLVETLADAVAGLHRLPALTGLGDLTDSIRVEYWTMPLRDVVHRYIRGYHELYRARASIRSPAIEVLYAWLYGNLPDSADRPVLLHGDIGFHNMVIDEGALNLVVDWEFAHIGDPAEDVAYVRNTAGEAIDWDAFLARYRHAGGAEISPTRLRFFQVWGQVRNATAAALLAEGFARGSVTELKMGHAGLSMPPVYIDAACALIGPSASTIG